MIRRLLAKELAEHWRLLVAIVTLEALGLAVLLALNAAENEAVSIIQAFQLYLVAICPLGASIAMQALFARELRSRTILFLESLPIPRSRPIIAKLLVAVPLVFGGVLAGEGLVLLLARTREPVELWFALNLTLKAVAITALVFALTFLASVLGRYRWPLFFSLLALSFVYDESGGDLEDVPPFSLLGADFATERFSIPAGELAWLAAVSAAILGLGLLLLALRRGSVAQLLGESMSHREKVSVAGALLATMLAASVFTEEERNPPYQINAASAVRRENAFLSVTVVPSMNQQVSAQLVADHLHSGLEALSAFLEFDDPPPVFVIHRSDLDPARFEIAQASMRDGLVVRANLNPESGSRGDLLAFVTGALIDDLTDSRSLAEDRHWLRDGLAERWAETHSPEEERTDLDRLWLRALYAWRSGVDPSDVDRWFAVHDALGEPIPAAFAWSGLVELEEALGPDRAAALFRAAFEPDPQKGLRGFLGSRSRTLDALLPPELTREAFFERWRSRLARENERLGGRLAGVHRLHPVVTVQGAADSRLVTVSVTSDPPLDRAQIVSAVWLRLSAVDAPIPELQLAREDRQLDREVSITIPAPFQAGARVFLASTMYSPELGCELRFGAERRTVE